MNNTLKRIIFYLLILVLIYHIIRTSHIEPFTVQPLLQKSCDSSLNIILIGDIFNKLNKNNNLSKALYTKYSTKPFTLTILPEKDSPNSCLFSYNILDKIINTIPNTPNTYIFLSTEYDIIYSLICEPGKQVMLTTPPSLFNDGRCPTTIQYYNRLKTSLDNINIPKDNITIVSTYELPTLPVVSNKTCFNTLIKQLYDVSPTKTCDIKDVKSYNTMCEHISTDGLKPIEWKINQRDLEGWNLNLGYFLNLQGYRYINISEGTITKSIQENNSCEYPFKKCKLSSPLSLPKEFIPCQSNTNDNAKCISMYIDLFDNVISRCLNII